MLPTFKTFLLLLQRTQFAPPFRMTSLYTTNYYTIPPAIYVTVVVIMKYFRYLLESLAVGSDRSGWDYFVGQAGPSHHGRDQQTM